MIEFDFKGELLEGDDLSENEEEFKDIIGTAIELTCFICPIVFIANGVDFFLFKGKERMKHFSMPIVNLASEGLYHVRRLPERKKITYDLPEGIGYLYFIFENGKVKLRYPFMEKEAEVDYQELLDAFLQFREKVRSFLRENTPHILENPEWGAWVAGEELPDEMESSQN